MSQAPHSPLVVGLGAGSAPGSSTEAALSAALQAAERRGARTRLFGMNALADLPMYAAGAAAFPAARDLVEAVRHADGLILASPAYHGSVSGLVKNAIDYFEETARDERPYLTDLPVGLISVAGGWQAAASTLATLRTIVHALRGWPTPFGAVVNSAGGLFQAGQCSDPAVSRQIALVGEQVVDFAVRVTRPDAA